MKLSICLLVYLNLIWTYTSRTEKNYQIVYTQKPNNDMLRWGQTKLNINNRDRFYTVYTDFIYLFIQIVDI